MINILDGYEGYEICRDSNTQKIPGGTRPGDLVNVSVDELYGSLYGFILEFDIPVEGNHMIRKVLHIDLGEMLESRQSGLIQGVKEFCKANEFNEIENDIKIRGMVTITNEKQKDGDYRSQITDFVPEWIQIKQK